MSGSRVRVVVLLLALSALIAPAARSASFPVPRGYRIAGIAQLAQGVTHVRYVAVNPRRNLNVAYIKRDAAVRMRVVVSNERVAGGTETVRSMCARVNCLMGVNGDLFSFGSGQPAGGMASGGMPLRTPPDTRHHITQRADGTTAIERLRTTTRFFVDYPDRTEPFFVHGVNVGRGANQAVLYTDRWAPGTQTGPGFEITLSPVEQDATPAFGRPMRVRMIRGWAGGDTAILPGTMVLSAHGWYADLLSQVWSDVMAGVASPEATLTFGVSPNVETFSGGTPALLLNRRQAFIDRQTSFYAAQARTLAGRAANGDTILAVIDGGRGSYWTGVRLLDAMRLMSTLGAVDALNLDGGGSSTFVAKGRAVNHPVNGERGVASALVLVPRPPPT